VLVKLDSPKGAHYTGGDIAAPVTRIVLRAALSARDAALNRDDLAASEKLAMPKADEEASRSERPLSSPAPSTTLKASDKEIASELLSLQRRVAGEKLTKKAPTISFESDGVEAALVPDREEPAPYVIKLPALPKSAPKAITPRAVPNVAGMSIREAVRALHLAGFRVQLDNEIGSSTLPVAGTIVPPGTLVRLGRPAG
jgi:hypothetical protein